MRKTWYGIWKSFTIVTSYFILFYCFNKEIYKMYK